MVVIAAAIAACGSDARRYPAPSQPITSVSNRNYEALLAKYVADDGKVAYQRWHDTPADVAALDAYLGVITTATPDSRPDLFSTPAAQLSYWLNLYNALVLREVLRRWPLDSVRDVKAGASSYVIPGKGFFGGLSFEVGGRTLTLDDIEHRVLRRRFADPRIHFAINCGSASCPILRADAFDAAAVETQLQGAARAFIGDPDNVAVDHAGRVLRLSKIFDWYREDFVAYVRARGAAQPHLADFLALYADAALAADLARAKSGGYAVAFRDYDWSVNRAGASSGTRTARPATQQPAANHGPATAQPPADQRPAGPQSPATGEDAGPLGPGAPMPDVEIELIDELAGRVAAGADELVGDQIWRPSQARGKVVLLDFWATYCRPCRAAFPAIDTEWKKRRDRGLVVIAVSEDDDLAQIAAFVAETGVTFPIGIDPDQEFVAPPMSLRMLPTEIVIDRRGVVRYRHEGMKPGDIERLFEEIDSLLAESP